MVCPPHLAIRIVALHHSVETAADLSMVGGGGGGHGGDDKARHVPMPPGSDLKDPRWQDDISTGFDRLVAYATGTVTIAYFDSSNCKNPAGLFTIFYSLTSSSCSEKGFLRGKGFTQ